MDNDSHSMAAAAESLAAILPEGTLNIGQAEDDVEQTAPEPTEPPVESDEGGEAEITKPDGEAKEAPTSEDTDDVEVEVNGSTYRVPSELKDAILMHKDYTQKTMKLAEERKALEADKGKVPEELQAKLTKYEALLGQQVLADKQVDWVKLLENDPIQYLKEKELAEARRVEFDTISAQKQEENVARLSQAANEQWTQLTAKRPDLKEEAAFKAHDERVRGFLAKEGYSNQQIHEAVFDHKVRLMVEDAIAYRNLQSKKAETVKKIEKLPPKIERPGVSSGAEGQATQAAMTRLKQTGKVSDAAAAIRSMLG